MPKTPRTIRSVVLGLAVFLGMLGCFGVSASPASAQVAVGVAVSFGPPEIPIYDQPPCPGEDYIWTPGYWDWDGEDYYWVPGTWVLAPEPEFLWTPGFWGWNGTAFVFTAGYWGPVVGFYGGINYGFGYFGHGFEGGRWERGHFFYNRAVLNVNVNVIHNTYETRIVERNVTRVSYNGGRGGIDVRANAEEERAAHERHIAPVAAQTRHVEEARADRSLRFSQNHGRPSIGATQRPAEFHGNGATAAREGGAARTENNPRVENNAREENRAANNAPRPNPATHVRDLPPAERPARPNTGNSKIDQKYQQQQDKLAQQQARDREKLQTRQEKEHQQVQRQNNETARQQMEQRHQQQTQQMVQHHQQQSQQLERRQAPPPASSQKKH